MPQEVQTGRCLLRGIIVAYINSFWERITIWVLNGSAAKRVAVDHEVYISVVPNWLSNTSILSLANISNLKIGGTLPTLDLP